MAIPDSLQYKIDHFRRFGRLVTEGMELFGNASWLAVHIGQQNQPERYDPVLDLRGAGGRDMLEQQRQAMARGADAMPTHAAFIRQYVVQ